jgi:hypothetical protein
MARQSVEAFDLATELDHPGESGRAREETLRRFLLALVPPDFGVDTGFVIDALGGVSRQIDIVIFRKQRAPLLEIGGIKHFMVESVAAVIETKATVSSKSVLTQALDNIASVKQLDRTNEGRTRIVGAPQPLDMNTVQHQVWGGVVTGRSMKFETCLDAIAEWLKVHPRTQWFNTYVDIHDLLIDYGHDTDAGGPPTTRSSDPMLAGGLVGSCGLDAPLTQFGVELLNFLRVTPLLTFNPTGYFNRVTVPMESWYEFPEGFGSSAEPT